MSRLFVLCKANSDGYRVWHELPSYKELQEWIGDGSLEEGDLVVWAKEVSSIHEQKILSLKKETKE